MTWRLGQSIKYIPLTQGKFAIIDEEDFNLVSQYKWHAANNNYTFYARNGKSNRKPRLIFMHRIILNIDRNQLCDHINGNGLDNRKSNLRTVTANQNMFNSRKQKNNTSSKFKGVCWHINEKKWHARIGFNGKRIHLGVFKDEVDAARAYDEAAKKYFGEYARLNQV